MDEALTCSSIKYCLVFIEYLIENGTQIRILNKKRFVPIAISPFADFADLTIGDLGFISSIFLTSSFYEQRSKKRKKDSQVKQLFVLSGSLRTKAVGKNIDVIDTWRCVVHELWLSPSHRHADKVQEKHPPALDPDT